MLASWVTSIVRFCIRFPWPIIALGIVASTIGAVYSVRHFAITTDINKLISPDLDWRKREAEFEKAFPGHFGSTLVVVNAPTAELAARASADLVTRLKTQPQLFRSVDDIEGSDFFARNGLLFRHTDDVANMAKGLGQAAPLIGTLASDPSLRGMTRALSLGLIGVQNKMVTLDALARPLSMASTTVEEVLANRPASFSWLSMLSGADPKPDDLRRLVEVQPVLDFSALQPGKASSDEIRRIANELQLKDKYQARVRLTGSVPIADEEFGSVQDGALENAIGTIIVVLTILWLALKSPRIILAVIINLFVGLSLTAALGLAMVGALNMISVAFAVLFVGLGVDFGIQFAVRYRAERHDVPKLPSALTQAAEKIGVPLTLAAAAVAAGFMSFLPTDYRGVSELGQIAGVGMLIAYATSITLLPALITLLNPEGEPEEIGYRALAPVDRFLETQRIPVIVGTLAVALLGSPLLYYLTFDFDPIHLRSTKTESISTLLDLGGDPRAGVNSVNIILPSVDEAAAAAEKLQKLPEVSQVSTLLSFVPQDQDKKLAIIQDLSRRLGQSLQPSASGKPPTDADNVAALNGMADQLNKIAGNAAGPGADAARRLAANAMKLAQADEAARTRAQNAFVVPLQTSLGQLRGFLTAQRITKENLPQSLRRLWVTPDGRARVEASPKGNTDDTEVLRSIRARNSRRLSQRHRRSDFDSRVESHGGQGILRSGFLRAGLDRDIAVDRAGPLRRRAADARAPAARRRRDAGNLCPDRHAAQFREYHRAAVAARRRRGFQDLLHHGLAVGTEKPAAVKSHPRRHLERAHDRDGIWKPLAFEASRHVEHGQAARAVAGVYVGRRGAISARAHGEAPRRQGLVSIRRQPAKAAASPSCDRPAPASTEFARVPGRRCRLSRRGSSFRPRTGNRTRSPGCVACSDRKE